MSYTPWKYSAEILLQQAVRMPHPKFPDAIRDQSPSYTPYPALATNH